MNNIIISYFVLYTAFYNVHLYMWREREYMIYDILTGYIVCILDQLYTYIHIYIYYIYICSFLVLEVTLEIFPLDHLDPSDLTRGGGTSRQKH